MKEEIRDLNIAKKLIQLHGSAMCRQLEFNVTLKKVKQLLNQKKCYYTGVEFGIGPLQRTIDRVDNSKGYIDSNIVACTQKINLLKADLTLNELNLFFKKLNHYQNGKKTSIKNKIIKASS